MSGIIVSKEEIYKMMEELDVRKAMGPDGISGLVLKECKKQLIEPIYDINSSLKSGKVPKEWRNRSRKTGKVRQISGTSGRRHCTDPP